MGSRSFAFLSFLDLISCAFGAAVLLSLVAMSDDQSAESSQTKADVLLVRFRRTANSEPVEVHLYVDEPSGRAFRTTGDLPRDYSRFVSGAQNAPESFLVIPKPASGVWTLQAFWVSESIPEGGAVELEFTVHCPRLPRGAKVTFPVRLDAARRFSEPKSLEILATPDDRS